MPISIRLTLAFTAVMALVLVAVGLFVYSRVGSDLEAALDTSLRTRADDLAATAIDPGDALGRAGPPRRERREPFAGDRALTDASQVGSPGFDRRAAAPGDPSWRARGKAPIFLDRDSVAGFDERVRLLARPADGRVVVVGRHARGPRRGASARSAASC